MTVRSTPSLLLSVLTLAPAAAAQCPVLTPMSPGSGSSSLDFAVTAFGQDLYFDHHTPAQGTELWKWSPATGFGIVADIIPGIGSSRPYHPTPCCTAQGPRVFFTAGGTSGYEPYITDGNGGATLVKDIKPGSGSSLAQEFVAVGNRVMFIADNGVVGDELWISDGTAAGTQLVLDIRAGGTTSNSNPDQMTALDDQLVFTADDGINGRELWISDGTAGGTFMLADIRPGSFGSSPYDLTLCGDEIFFAADDGTNGTHLWKTDGTLGGTVMVSSPGVGGAPTPRDICCCGDRVFFHGRYIGKNNVLFVSDGSSASPVQTDLPNAVVVSNGTPERASIVCSGDRVFFPGTGIGGRELWISDGTDAGTYMVADIHTAGSASPAYLTPIGTGVAFTADDATNGRELWFSDGTAAGTFLVCDIDPNGSSNPRDFQVASGHLLFTAVDPVLGEEPYVQATPGAHVAALGGAGAPAFPTIEVRDGAAPVLGTPITIDGDDGPAGSLGFLFAAPPIPPAPPVPPFMQGGCDYGGLLTGLGLPAITSAAPSLSWTLNIPVNPVLEGQQLQLQVVWFNSATIPALQLSDALLLTLGEAAPH